MGVCHVGKFVLVEMNCQELSTYEWSFIRYRMEDQEPDITINGCQLRRPNLPSSDLELRPVLANQRLLG